MTWCFDTFVMCSTFGRGACSSTRYRKRCSTFRKSFVKIGDRAGEWPFPVAISHTDTDTAKCRLLMFQCRMPSPRRRSLRDRRYLWKSQELDNVSERLVGVTIRANAGNDSGFTDSKHEREDTWNPRTSVRDTMNDWGGVCLTHSTSQSFSFGSL